MENKSYRVKQCEHCKAKNIIARPPATEGTFAHTTLSCSNCGEYPGPFASYRDCSHDPVHAWDEKGLCVKLQAKKRKRAKQVFSTGEIPHLWAHQVQASARNPQGNLFFENETIYSYGSHFPIATHVSNKRGRKAILFTTRTYSSTTSGHVSAVRSSIPKNIPVFKVLIVATGWRGSHVYADTNSELHRTNVKAYLSSMKENIDRAQRARTLWSKQWKTREALGFRQELVRYAKFFGLKLPEIPKVPKLTAALVRKMKAREAFLASDGHKAVLVIDRARREMNEDFKRRRAAANAIEEWRKGNRYARLPYGLPVMLRIDGSDVETSLGARVPVSHAKRVLKIVRSIVASGEGFVSNGRTIPVGVYKVDRIEASGTLHAGCHHIPFTEIQSIAPLLEATPNEPSTLEVAS